jgi:hypothetical protein
VICATPTAVAAISATTSGYQPQMCRQLKGTREACSLRYWSWYYRIGPKAELLLSTFFVSSVYIRPRNYIGYTYTTCSTTLSHSFLDTA